MEHSDFKIGTRFVTGSGVWRCTDIGTRTIAAIRLDNFTVTDANGQRTLTEEEAQKAGYFGGPPYMTVEELFDEYDLEGCEPENFLDFPGYEDRPPKRDWSQAVRGPYKEAIAILRERHAQRLRQDE